MDLPLLAEWLCCIIIVVSSLFMISRNNPLYAALWLINAFVFTGVLYLVQGSAFMGFLQILTYAGAILVLVLFTLMLMDLRAEQDGPPQRRALIRFMAGASLAASAILLIRFFGDSTNPLFETLPVVGHEWGGLKFIGRHLYEAGGLFPFEFITVLLLSTLVGCVDLCKKRLP